MALYIDNAFLDDITNVVRTVPLRSFRKIGKS